MTDPAPVPVDPDTAEHLTAIARPDPWLVAVLEELADPADRAAALAEYGVSDTAERGTT